MSTGRPPRVAVIGAGLVGVALAISLAERGIEVKLYERHAEFHEIGASIGVNYCAAEALRVCGPAAHGALMSVLNRPKNEILFTMRDGYNQPPRGQYNIPWDGVSGGVHRVHFHRALVDAIPEGIAVFNKRLDDVVEPEDSSKPVVMKFSDGTEEAADVVIGCDGIGSHVRRHLLGEHHPSTRARYAHRFAFRCVLPMNEAIAAVGEEDARQSSVWMGKGAQIVTVIVAKGEMLGITAMVHDDGEWPDEHHLVLPSSKDEVAGYFKDWSPKIRQLINAIHPNVDKWALFDLADNPVPFFARSRIALAGDAAHATTPHLGSGAGVGFEDAAVLSELLADERLRGKPENIEKALAAYDEVRRPRGHWLTKGSRHNGLLLEFRDPVVGDDMMAAERYIKENYRQAWYANIDEFMSQSKAAFEKRL